MSKLTIHDPNQGLSQSLLSAAGQIPNEGITLRDLLEKIGEQGMLLFCMILTIPFLIPVSVPGVSTVFGLLIVLIGIGVTLNRVPWLPNRLLDRHFTSAQLVPALHKGASWFQRLDRLIRPRWLVLTHGGTINRVNGLALVFSGILLMAPLGLIPLSNTIPGLACLALATGMLQRDGLFVVLGYVFMVATVIYFSVLALVALAAGAGLSSFLGSG